MRWALLSALVLAGCSSREPIEPVPIDGGAAGRDGAVVGRDASSDTDGGPSPELWTVEMLIDAYCDATVDAYCDAAMRCTCATPCDPAATAAERDRCARELRDAESFGLTRWYGPRVEELLESYRRYLASCLYMPDDVFDQLFRGAAVLAADVGESCTPFPYACAEGRGTCSGGVCRELPAVDAACELLCEYPARCSAGTCVVPGADGSPCADDAACAAPGRCVAGACVVPGATGATCASTPECEPMHHCVGGTCTPATTCDGADACGQGTSCGGRGLCEPVVSAGGACTADVACERGFVCAGTPATCVPAPAVGEPCAPSGRCAVDAWCDGTTCALLRSVGETCTVGGGGREDCATGFCDRTGSCAELASVGEMCDRLPDCTSDAYCDATVFPRICVPRRGVGEACAMDVLCEAGLECVAGVCQSLTGLECDTASGCGDGSDRTATHYCRTADVCSCML